jgi:hypothetical protein
LKNEQQIHADFAEWTEWIENLLSVLVSLRIFIAEFHYDRHYPEKGYLSFMMEISNRAPNLEYMAIFDSKFYYGRRVRGEWVLCDEAEFLSAP